MSYNEDFDEEPEVIVKKKGGLLGKVVSLLLGVVIGAVGALGGTAGLGYYLATKKTIDEVLDYANVNESLYNEYISSEYTSKTLLDAILTTANVLIGFKDGTGTLGDLAAISPLIETKVLEFIESGKDAYGINFEYDEEHQIMNTPINEINQYIHDCILNTTVGDLFLKFGDGNDILDALCYGIEGEDYIVDENGEVQMLNGKTKMLVGDFAGGGFTERINALPLDALMDVDLNDSTVCSVAYGAEHHYTIIENTDGTKSVSMNQAFYTLDTSDQDNIEVCDDNGDPVEYTKIVEVNENAYVLLFAETSNESVAATADETASAETNVEKLLLRNTDMNGNQGEDGVYFVYEVSETNGEYGIGSPVRFEKTTLGDLQGDMMGTINNVTLQDALNVTYASHPLLISLAYGEEGTDFEYVYNEQGEKTGINVLTTPLRTVGDFRNGSQDFIDEIALTSVITPKTDDKIIMYLLYGKQDVHYELNDGKVEMLQKQVAVDADGKVYNEYGEELAYAQGTASFYTQKDKDDNVLATYTLTVITGKTLKIGETETPLYYVSDENGNAVKYETTRMKDLSGDSALLSNMTSRLALGDILDVGNNKILRNLSDVTITNLPTAIDELTVGEVFDEDMHYKNTEGAYTDKDGVLVTEKSDALRPTWKYLLKTKKEDGSVYYKYDYKITSDMGTMVENIEYNMQNTSLEEMNTDGVIKTHQSLRDTDIDTTVIDKANDLNYTELNITLDSDPTLGDLTVNQLLVYLECYMLIHN